MPNTVITIKKSATPAAAPSSLANGELALNFADGILYYKRANGTIGTISGTGGGGGASSYGIVNANGTLLLAGIPTDTFSILPGQNITIVGDAINDRVTIGADLSPANNYANTVGTAGNNYTNTVGASSNAYTNSVGTAGNNYASILVANTAVGANGWANTLSTTDKAIANNWANTKLSNTSGVSFSGNLFFPNGNVSINTTSANLRLEVGGNMSVDAFIENSVNIATSYTITTGRNALSAGPITINSGVTVTVPSGSTWTVV